MSQLSAEQEVLIQSFINVMEVKDAYTQGHSHHVKVIVKSIYDCLPKNLQNNINNEKLIFAASLHDIGKVFTKQLLGFIYFFAQLLLKQVIPLPLYYNPLPCIRRFLSAIPLLFLLPCQALR